MDKVTRKSIATVLGIAAACFLLWYFRNIVVYLALSIVVSLIGGPLVRFITKFHVGKLRCPIWLAAIITIVVILSCVGGFFALLYPIVSPIVERIGEIGSNGVANQITPTIKELNDLIIRTFPSVGEDFSVVKALQSQMAGNLHLGNVGSVISTLFSTVSAIAIGLFSVVFISFFLLSNDGLFTKTVAALAPEKYEAQIHHASDSIGHLLSRYFLGIIAESIGITMINSLGLIFILRMDTGLAITLGLVTGLLNIIPYLGPFIGHVLALILSAFVTYYSTSLGVSLPIYLAMTLGITMTTQLIDNYLFQPLIYASSVKAHPLEIFLVILVAAKIGGIFGMLAAVPAYTVLRVIAAEFLSKFRFFDTISKGLEAEEGETIIARARKRLHLSRAKSSNEQQSS